MPLASFLIGPLADSADHVSLAVVPQIGRHVVDAGVAGPVVVPIHKSHYNLQ